MRLWSIHPCYLDSKGLVALWREGLLAQNVILGLTKGYKNHPQLIRFKNKSDPKKYISNYLYFVWKESKQRNFKFQIEKIKFLSSFDEKIFVNSKQLDYEWKHFLNKLKIRDIKRFNDMIDLKNIKCHPIFKIKEGDIENWEKL